RLNGNHQSDPKAPCRGRLQIGTASGIKLECLSGFASEYPSGFIGIRMQKEAQMREAAIPSSSKARKDRTPD
ncbi:MAG TPA: hypothetical protein VGN91_10835, partial [Bosea sp. (in: a-proteobacteria)]|nr:hypothetical protein [Bosea sp. (in: a-proteobacteria)]